MAFVNALDPADIAERLGRTLGATVTDVEVPAAGFSAETILFTATRTDGSSRGLVARVKPEGDALFLDYDLEQEARVLRALQGTGVPVPGIVALETDSSVLGSPFLVMERVEGRIAPDDPPFPAGSWVTELGAIDGERLADSTLRALVDLHAIDLDAVGLRDVGHGDPALTGLDRLLDYWTTFADWALVEPNPTVRHGLAWVKENRPSDLGPEVLSWGDARIGNMIVPDDLSVGAIIDWEMVATGPRELDLGWWLFLLAHHSAGIGAPLPAGFRDRDAEIARYEELSGHRVQNLHYFEVLAGVRMGVLVARAATLMKGAGLIPADSPMAQVNPATVLLANLLGLPVPTGESDYYIGNR